MITIHNPNGTVTVKAWTKQEVMVLADHSSTNIEVDAVQTGNRIDVVTRPLSSDVSPEDVRADFQINVPEDAELQIHNDSGAVSVNDVLGDMNVDTVGADVGLEDAAGYLTVKTVGGSFQCLRCAGRIEVSSISGNFRLIDSRTLLHRRADFHRQYPIRRKISSQRNVSPQELQRPDRSPFFARTIPSI